MANVNVSELSDSELRNKLKEFKQAVGPITKSTRRIWEKKLQKYLDESNNETVSDNGKPNKRRSAGRGRSTTTNLANAVETVNVKKSIIPSRSATHNRSRANTKQSQSNNKLAMFSSDEEDHTHHTTMDTPPVVPTRSIQTSPVGFPSPEVVLTNVNFNPEKRRSFSQNTISYVKSPIKHISSNTTNKCARTNNDFDGEIHIVKSNRRSSRRTDFSDDDFSENTTQSKSFTNNTTRNSSTVEYSPATIVNNKNNLRDRTSQLYLHSDESNTMQESYRISSKPIKNSSNRDFNEKMREEINASIKEVRRSFSVKKPSPVRFSENLAQKTEHSEGEEDDNGDDVGHDDEEEELEVEFDTSFSFFRLWKQKWTYIVLLLLLFFTGFAVWLYLYTDSQEFTGIPATSDLEKKTVQAINCLYKDLSEKAGNKECGYDNIVKGIDVNDLQYHKCLKIDGANVKEIRKKINTTYARNFRFTGNDGNVIESSAASKSLSCRISTALYVILYRMAFVVAVIAGVLTLYYVLKRRWMVDDEETRQMLYFVDKIIDTLRRHHSVCVTDAEIPPYLAIPHVRDMLIPLSSRKKMEKVWKKAVEFLNSSDSRIRVETQQIAGEDFEVWRWIGVITPKINVQKKDTKSQHLVNEPSKIWQGPAFDEIEKVVRMPIVPPTPCLKIRYMHEGPDEKGENWESLVKKSVLEKCQKDGAEILHLFVDKSSKEGCVYVKCESRDSAGKSFRSMYGNWFDGRLIIVKFVTLARYHQRFPDSLRVTVPLKHVTDDSTDDSLSSLVWTE